MTPRMEVYAIIDEERNYQDSFATKSETDGQHTVAEFLLYMHHYLDAATTLASTEWGAGASEKSLHMIRKITALGVACMEQNGAPRR